MKSNILIIGAGVVGLAIAYKLSLKFKDIIIIDSENSFGTQTSSRNTQLIHAGIYYKKHSLKSKFCLLGKQKIYEFCNKYKVNYKNNKKIFIANTQEDITKLDLTLNQAQDNGVDDLCELNKSDIKKTEPYLNGIAGLLSPSSGIIDVHDYMEKLLKISIDNNVIFAPNHKLINAERKNNIWNAIIQGEQNYNLKSNIIINSAGNESTNISKKIFNNPDIPDANPLRGSYLTYNSISPFTHTIYPALVPGENSPRVDATPDIYNILRFGPSTDIGSNSYDMNSNLINIFLPEIIKYFPLVKKENLKLDFCGFRPKISFKNKFIEDYIIKWNNNLNWLDLWGIDSPGLTASLAIADHVEQMITKI